MLWQLVQYCYKTCLKSEVSTRILCRSFNSSSRYLSWNALSLVYKEAFLDNEKTYAPIIRSLSQENPKRLFLRTLSVSGLRQIPPTKRTEQNDAVMHLYTTPTPTSPLPPHVAGPFQRRPPPSALPMADLPRPLSPASGGNR